jgi:hypothetical protein
MNRLKTCFRLKTQRQAWGFIFSKRAFLLKLTQVLYLLLVPIDRFLLIPFPLWFSSSKVPDLYISGFQDLASSDGY